MSIKDEFLIIKRIREYFNREDFLEVFVPHLYPFPNLDGEIDNFIAFFKQNNRSVPFYLTTSPEYFMKHILSKGYDKIYNISSSFRNGEIDDDHLPEFLMLEWYEKGNDIDILINRVKELFEYVYKKQFNYKIYDMLNLLKEERIDITRINSKKYMFAIAHNNNIIFDEGYSLSDIFWAIFYDKIKNKIDWKDLVFIKHYPVFTGGMARRHSEFPIFSLRVESYFNGREIANGYVELLDSEEMFERMKEHAKEHSLRYYKDEKFLNALNNIGDDYIGMALGVHRLPGFNMTLWKELMGL